MSTNETIRDVRFYTLRDRLTAWWETEMSGKTTLCVPEAARRAEREFVDDSEFREGFLAAYLYQVLYDRGISLLSERRSWIGDATDSPDVVSEWMEYDPGSQTHTALFSMSPEQLLASADHREKRIRTELERVRMLRELATSPHAGNRPADPVSATRRLRDRIKLVVSTQEQPPVVLSPQTHADEMAEQGIWPPNRFVCGGCGREEVMQWEAGDGARYPRHVIDAAWSGVCRLCATHYPASLMKACCDPFDYALKLRTGEVVSFHTCQFQGEWVHLELGDIRHSAPEGTNGLPYGMERGIDVRLSDIVWCADAPEGS